MDADKTLSEEVSKVTLSDQPAKDEKPKVDVKEQPKEKPAPKKQPKKNAPQEITPYALDIRVGKILSVERHPDADSLFIEKIDVGEEKPRNVCSGLVGKIEQSDIQDQYVLVACNLKPGNMRGVTSEAMILCATDAVTSAVELLKIPSSAKVGDKVEYEGYEARDADEQINSKKLTKLMPLWGTDAQGNVVFDKTHTVKLSGEAVKSTFINSLVK
ncbi:tyrosine tRS [Acrasis kona]|uniref:Tyrosine tRNA synthetase n=1 Tax=Acrasis kona TaxID=1008807 RepID=A0AAW2ZMD7_9EUKA